MSLMCFNQVLRNYIEKYLVEFFAVTNFGTMQEKVSEVLCQRNVFRNPVN